MKINYDILRRLDGHTSCPKCAARFHFVLKSHPGLNAERKKSVHSAAKTSKNQNKTQRVSKRSRAKKLNYRVPKYIPQKALSYRVPKYSNTSAQTSFFAHRGQPETLKHAKNPQQPNVRPYAPTLEKNKFAEVGSDALTFNLLENQPKNLPINIAGAAKRNALSSREQSDQHNNFTIHTDNLVFTLVNAEGNKSAATFSEPHATPHVVTHTNTHSEINWVIASIGALIILIVQLFYLILMMI